MQPDDATRIRHMIEAAQSAQTFISGKTRQDLDNDKMLLFAVVRAIEIIGEAASRITEETKKTAPNIPWRAISGMRNRLIHAYFDVDADFVWIAAAQEAPALVRQLQAMAF